ncbi:hypothetical protein K503DRAFT_870158 [Rhizopogon vinicolor AM-OR11-026]|uniref:Uncharacterized protein n=1 Tax=Rhizopogon vinicolor AM-OR11-026 TaxID=1314800 RepID=A0A1B7MIK1_9AGAM|nr:hypothetical protein K503DRAFT_870158 [Rhizopogon vinicolor AM-OR11-026]
MPFSSIVYAIVILCNATEVKLQTSWFSAANVKNSDLIHLPSCGESQSRLHIGNNVATLEWLVSYSSHLWCNRESNSENDIPTIFLLYGKLCESLLIDMAAWRNGIASDYDYEIRRLQVRPLRWSFCVARGSRREANVSIFEPPTRCKSVKR